MYGVVLWIMWLLSVDDYWVWFGEVLCIVCGECIWFGIDVDWLVEVMIMIVYVWCGECVKCMFV